jgi:hypothetical protein
MAYCQEVRKLAAFAELAKTSIENYQDRSNTLKELSQAHEEIKWFHNLGDILQNVDDQLSSLEHFFSHVADLLPVRQAEVWAPDRDAALYQCLVHYDEQGLAKNPEIVKKTSDSDRLLRQMGLRVISEQSAHDEPPDRLVLALTRKLGRPLVALPLEWKGQLQGVLAMSFAERDFMMSPAQVKFIHALGRQVSLCVHLHFLTGKLQGSEALQRELELARHIQRSLLPQRVPRDEHYDLFAGCVMATEVGGDYYDFRERQGELGLLIADASGHSISSALIAMSFRSSFWHFVDLGLDMPNLFARINKSLAWELGNSDHFLSAFYCTYAPDDRNLCYVNAGHNRPFVYRSGRRDFVDLDEAGFLMGVMDEASYPIGEANLQRGDIVVLYTDGIVEAHSQKGEMFGLGRLRDAIQKYSARSAKGLYHSILKEMYIFQDERFNKDDITLILMKVS